MVVTLKRIPLTVQLAVRAALDSGKTLEAVSKESKLSIPTVWAIKHTKTLDQERVDAIRKRLGGKFYEIADASLNGITQEKIEKASVSQLIMAAGIATDKARLIEGQATARVEFRDATDQALEEEITSLEAQIAAGPVIDTVASPTEGDDLSPTTDGNTPEEPA